MDDYSERSLDAAAALRRAGLRVTAPRLAVLRALASGPPHASADALVSAVRNYLGDSSAQTVYNVLRSLADAGLVRRIEPAGHPGLYELRVGDNHHHLVCRICEAVTDVACAVGEAPCLTASDAAGYEIDEAEVVYWGRCPACVAAGAALPDESSPPPADGRHLQRSEAAWQPRYPTQPSQDQPSHEQLQRTPGEGKDTHV